MDVNLTVANNVKRIRESKKITLDNAARFTGVSKSMLCQIERGDVNPTISVLWKIANGFKVSFTALVEQELKDAAIIMGVDIQPLIMDNGRFINYPIFAFEENKGFESYRIEIMKDGCVEAEAHILGCEEYITVFAGTIEIIVGDLTYILKSGDSVHFCADVPHTYRNIGDETVQLSMIIYYK
jgi:transcriptional regulator with XRE-family HTH domain